VLQRTTRGAGTTGPSTIVVRQDDRGPYILEARGHVFNSRGEMVEGPVSPGTRMHVYFAKDDAGLQAVDRVVIATTHVNGRQQAD
jgi:hypothetical protein